MSLSGPHNTTVGNFSSFPVCDQWSGTSVEWALVIWGSLIISVLSIFLNGLNIIVFHNWKQKAPFLTFHISLSVGELLSGVAGLIGPVQYLTVTKVNIPAFETATAAVMILTAVCNYHFCLVSIDRWLSVEYPIWYRNQVTKPVVTVACLIVWLLFIVPFSVVFVVYRDTFYFVCNFGTLFTLQETWWQIYVGVWNPSAILLLGAAQMRLCYIAIKARLRISLRRQQGQVESTVSYSVKTMSIRDDATVSITKIRGRRGPKAAVQQGPRTLLNFMVKTVWAGLLVAVVGVACIVPSTVAYITDPLNVVLQASCFLVYSFRNVTPFFIYLAFYREYRSSLRSLWNLII